MRWVRDYGAFFLVLLLLFLLFFLLQIISKKQNPVLTFAMLDVGQGDALFIESPTGTQILIDGGPKNNVLKSLPEVMPFWDRKIDALIITNPDADHISGFTSVLDLYDVDMIFEPGTYNSSTLYKSINTKIKNDSIPNILLRRGMQIDLGGGAYLEVFFPDREVFDWSSNEGSAVLRLSYSEHTFMLTGDSTEKTEKIILSANDVDDLDSEFLKVGHHGSRTSTSDKFIEAVSPDTALISSGRGNSYGHPHREVLDRLAKYKSDILRTDTSGAILIKCARIGPCEINKSKN